MNSVRHGRKKWAYTYRIANFSLGSSDMRSPIWWTSFRDADHIDFRSCN